MILHAFAAFWRKHGEVLTGAFMYPEVAPPPPIAFEQTRTARGRDVTVLRA